MKKKQTCVVGGKLFRRKTYHETVSASWVRDDEHPYSRGSPLSQRPAVRRHDGYVLGDEISPLHALGND